MATEIEFKFKLQPQFVTDFIALPLIKAACISEPLTQNLYTTYYDTPDLVLRSKNIALRIRKTDQEWIQTIKSSQHISAGLHEQHEWDQPINSDQPDFSKITDTEQLKLFSDTTLRQQLQPIFVTDFTRTQYNLCVLQDCYITLCLDLGKIITKQHSKPICEVECELQSGSTAQLKAFAALLKEECTFPLVQENMNKAMHGYALYTRTN